MATKKPTTTQKQYSVLVSYMEKYGDLSRATSGNQRYTTNKRWRELSNALNAFTHKPRSEEKWRKVWSDFKTNTKKKIAKMAKRGNDISGGLPPCLSKEEKRVLAILKIPYKGTRISEKIDPFEVSKDDEINYNGLSSNLGEDEDMNLPGSSEQDVTIKRSYSSEESQSSEPDTPIKQRKTRKRKWSTLNDNETSNENEALNENGNETSDEEKLFAEYKNAFEYEKDKDRRLFELEKERIRQRDEELQLHREWLEFMKAGLGLLQRYLGEKK